MEIFICFNPSKHNPFKEFLLTHFNELSFETARRMITNNSMLAYPEKQICNGILDMKDIVFAFQHFSFSLVCLLNNNIVGIAILEIQDEFSLNVVYLCANKSTKISRIGTILIDNIKYITKLINLEYVVLYAIPSAVGFYEKMGFKFSRGNFMFIKVKDTKGGKSKRKKGKTKRKKILNTKTKRSKVI